MRTLSKRPCRICRRWFRPDPRVGARQRACRNSSCQKARHQQAQAKWCARNPDYFIARRIQARSLPEQPSEPLRLRPPLSRLPWDLAQDEFGIKGADVIGVLGKLLHHAAQDERWGYFLESTGDRGALGGYLAQDEIRVVF